MIEKDLKTLQKEYNRVCDKLEILNARAFELEKEMLSQAQKNKKSP